MAIRMMFRVSLMAATILMNVEATRPVKLNKRQEVGFTSDFTKEAALDMIRAATANPCKFADDHAVETKQSGFRGKSFIFEKAQNQIMSLEQDCGSLHVEEAKLQKISGRVEELKDESSVEESACAKIGEHDSVKKVESCLEGCKKLLKEAQEKEEAARAEVVAQADAKPELLKQDSKKGTEGSETEWCDNAVGLGTSLGRSFSGITVGFTGGSYEDKQAKLEGQKAQSDFADQCGSWHKAQKEVEKQESQKSALQSKLESKREELHCISTPVSQHESQAGCLKFNETLPDAQETVKTKKDTVAADADEVVVIMFNVFHSFPWLR
jgi:hypothetical protein